MATITTAHGRPIITTASAPGGRRQSRCPDSGHPPVTLSLEEREEREWKNSEELRAEFSDARAYSQWCAAKRAGAVL